MRDVMKEARLFAFLTWYRKPRNERACESVKDFIASICEWVNSGKVLTDKQIAACERIQQQVESNRELALDLEENRASAGVY